MHRHKFKLMGRMLHIFLEWRCNDDPDTGYLGCGESCLQHRDLFYSDLLA